MSRSDGVMGARVTKLLHGYRFQFMPERGDKATRASEPEKMAHDIAQDATANR